VHALPTLVALAAALLLTPPILRHLQAEGFTRENYRGAQLPFPGGIAIVAAGVLAVGLCTAVAAIAEVELFDGGPPLDLTYVLGVALLGLIDDLLSGPPARSRGWRGHGRAVMGGEFSTGALKAVGSLALAFYALQAIGYGDGAGEYLLAVALLVLTTNLFNLLDLRPGRSAKAFLLLGALLSLIAWHDRYGVSILLWIVGPLVAPILVVGFFDLKERTMLGDTGANVIGAAAGLWLIYAFDATGQLIALAIVLALTVLGEFRSLNTLIERTPLLRQIDSIGRNDAHA
jgi:UDP-GlcNAc:undecaprenyl-phosphate/decaprenyl-phosphate GlcNAc-1-phosphate transferase